MDSECLACGVTIVNTSEEKWQNHLKKCPVYNSAEYVPLNLEAMLDNPLGDPDEIAEYNDYHGDI